MSKSTIQISKRNKSFIKTESKKLLKSKQKIILHNNTPICDNKDNFIENFNKYLLNKFYVAGLDYSCITFDNCIFMFYNIIMDLTTNYKHKKNIIPAIIVDASLDNKYLSILAQLANQNKIKLHIIFPNCQGFIKPNLISKALTQYSPNICCVILSIVNKDTGSINEIQEIGHIVKNTFNTPFICECDQAFGVIEINILSSCIDILLINLYSIVKKNIAVSIINDSLININYLSSPTFTLRNCSTNMKHSLISSLKIIQQHFKNRLLKNNNILTKKELILKYLKKNADVIDIKSYLELYQSYKNNPETMIDNDKQKLYKNYFIYFGSDKYMSTTHISNILLFTFVPSIINPSIDITPISRYSIYEYLSKKKIEISFTKKHFDKNTQIPFSLSKCVLPKKLSNCLIKIYISDNVSNENLQYFLDTYLKLVQKNKNIKLINN
jgi:hypothetical protein